MKAKPIRTGRRPNIYKYKYLKTFINKSIITIVIIVVLLTLKITGFDTTNRLLENIRDKMSYKFNIIDDTKNLYYKAEGFIEKSIETVGVFSKGSEEKYLAPINGTLFKNYYNKKSSNKDSENNGIDLKAIDDFDPKSVSDGIVKNVELKGNKGYFITIENTKHELVYGYLSKPYLQENDTVKTGDLIGLLGTNKDGAKYLRFEVWIDGTPANTINYINLE